MWTTLLVHITVSKQPRDHTINNHLPKWPQGRKNLQHKYSAGTAATRKLQHNTAKGTAKVQPDIGFSGGRLGFVACCLRSVACALCVARLLEIFYS